MLSFGKTMYLLFKTSKAFKSLTCIISVLAILRVAIIKSLSILGKATKVVFVNEGNFLKMSKAIFVLASLIFKLSIKIKALSFAF